MLLALGPYLIKYVWIRFQTYFICTLEWNILVKAYLNVSFGITPKTLYMYIVGSPIVAQTQME